MAQCSLVFLGDIHANANEEQAEFILDSGLLQTCLKRLDDYSKFPQENNLLIIANIVVCEESKLQHYLEIGLFHKIINLMRISTIDIRIQGVWCLANSTVHANQEQM